MPTTAALVGGTGMVGSFIFSILNASPVISSIDILARRQPPSVPSDHPKTRSFIDADTSKWVPHVQSQSPAPQVFFSSLATTRAAAGGFENQYKLEHDLNVELAKAAKEAGTRVYVLISSQGANAKSMIPYTRMKGEIEDHIVALKFDRMIIVRPGFIAGTRQESRPFEFVVRKIAGLAGMISTTHLKDPWAQEADVIAKAAIRAALMAVNDEVKDPVWILKQSDIIRLGRTDWTGPKH